MRLLSFLLLSAAPLLAQAAGSLGFAIGDKNPDGTCKFLPDWEADLKAISGSGSKVVRVYAAADCDTAKWLLQAAKDVGFKVILGIWADTDDSFAKDKAAIVTYAPQFADQIYAITVGSESLYRGNFTGATLLEKIKDVRAAVNTGGHTFKIGTADSWNKYQDGTANDLIKSVDILLVNAFSYWQGKAIEDSVKTFFDDIAQAYDHIQKIAGGSDSGPELWVGETGYPTGGSSYQAAVPGLEAAKRYWQESICGIMAWGVNVFAFEAFDETWKPVSAGKDGTVADETHWGVYNADRSPKYPVTCS